jgi:hypothetical protein
MSQAHPMNDDARADDTERDDVLNAVSAKWKRLPDRRSRRSRRAAS